MDTHVKHVIEDCTRASDDARMTFPQVVMKLGEAGVERYHADLLRAEKTYYTTGGQSLVVGNDDIATPVASGCSAAGVEAAVRAVQAGAIDYKTFCQRVMAAGCAGYLVSMPGRRVVYCGRTGETHVELFPGAKG